MVALEGIEGLVKCAGRFSDLSQIFRQEIVEVLIQRPRDDSLCLRNGSMGRDAKAFRVSPECRYFSSTAILSAG